VRDLDDLIKRCGDACGYKVTIVPVGTETGIRDGTPEDDWTRLEELTVQARRVGMDCHSTFADLVLAKPRISDEVPYAVRDLFVLVEGHHHMSYFDTKTKVWNVDSLTARGALMEIIYTICKRRLQLYTTSKWTESAAFTPLDRSVSRYGNNPFLSHVAAVVQHRVRVAAEFEFDPKESLRYLKFQDRCFDRDTEEFVDVRPDMYITNTTGGPTRDSTSQESSTSPGRLWTSVPSSPASKPPSPE
jgi:hypothetical protein